MPDDPTDDPAGGSIVGLDDTAVLQAIERAKGSGAHRISVAEVEARMIERDGESATLFIALGLLHRERGQLEVSAGWFERAAEALAHSDSTMGGTCAVYLSSVYSQLGRFDEAEQQLRHAGAIVEASLRPTLELNWGFLFELSERLDDAVAAYERAASIAAEEGDEHVWSVAINNRAATLMKLGRLADAEVDLRMLAARSETSDRMRAIGQHNLGHVLGRRGAIREGLSRIDSAAAALGELHLDRQQAAVAEIEILIQARLVDEAGAAALAALDDMAHDATSLAYPDVMVMIGRIAIAKGELAGATGFFRDAAAVFAEQEREPSRRQAHAVADLLDGIAVPGLGPDEPGADAVYEALVAIADRRPHEARQAFERARTALDSQRSPLRILGLYADAHVHLLDADVDAARQSARALMAEIAASTADINSIELRASVVFHSVDLERLAVALARAGDPVDLLRLIDQAGSVVHSSTPLGRADQLFVGQLEELRTSLAGLAPSQIRQGELLLLENRLRALARRSERSAHAPTTVDACDRLALAESGGLVVLYAVADDRLWRLACNGGEGSRLDDLGPFVEAARAVRQLRFAATLLARPMRNDPALGIAKLDRAGAALEAVLFAGLDVDSGDMITVVPGRHLTSVPWRMLPTAHRWNLAINAGTPLGFTDAPLERPQRVLAVAGPGLSAAVRRELEGVAAAYPEARILAGAAATVEAVLAALPDADVLHLAGHGALHPTDPLMSTIDLADGPLTAYDIEMLAMTPRLVVLASCEVGTVGKTGSDVNYSLASVLASRGSTDIVISPLELHDEQTSVVMPVLHRALAAGMSGRDALQSLSFDNLATQRAVDSLLCVEAVIDSRVRQH